MARWRERRGEHFWNRSLPAALAAELGGVDQEIPPLEATLTAGPIRMNDIGRVLAELVEDYRQDLEGRKLVKSLQRRGGKTYALAETLSVDRLKKEAQAVRRPADVARILVRVAGCYSPDYGVVDHPCHRWCPRWGRCEDLQRPALHSVLLHLCQAWTQAGRS